MTRILVLNPNSNPEVTTAMDRALDPWRFADGPQIGRYWRLHGLAGSVVGDLPINSSVADLADEASTFDRMTNVGQRLKTEHGADSLLMGCAGMARYRKRLEDALQIPVVDPTQAAVGMTINKLCCG